MTRIDLVKNVNAELRELEAEAWTQGENPRVKRLIRCLIQLTEPFNPDAVPEPECKHERVEQGVCVQCGGTIPSLQTEAAVNLASHQAACTHTNISPFGVCRDCGKCMHEFRSSAGICNQCGEQADLEAPAA
jgi:hypothetical protein